MPDHKLQQTLMLFSIGPVQDFIAQARRTRDLWFGSHLLSELAKAGAKAFEKQAGTLIYPVLSTDENVSLGAPNKILGVIETDNPRDVAWKVRRAVTGQWREYAALARQEVESLINPGIWEKQIGDLVEFYVAWTPIEKNSQDLNIGETGYSRALERAEELLAARKTLRDFKQNDPGRTFGDKKSSLDGGRESVWTENGLDRQKLARLGVKEKETLDAVSVIKRLSLKTNPQQKTFFSVCETAFLPYEERIQNDPTVERIVHHYLNRVAVILNKKNGAADLMKSDKGDYDARLFYARRIEDYLEEEAKVSEEQKQNRKNAIVVELEKLYGTRLDENGNSIRIPEPSPYYAFLVADGDRMGKHLREIKDQESHRKFSEALSRFSVKAAHIMQKHQGTLVYGGGDDVMAYLPVHQCLQAVDKLRECFVSTMLPVVPKKTENSEEPLHPVSLSAGIVIVHMLEPLEEVRQMAHAAEQQAKQTRDTFVVQFHKRGGGDLMRVTLPFVACPVTQMQQIRSWMRQPIFSVQFAYALRDLYQTYEKLSDSSTWLTDTKKLEKLLWLEIGRLARKKKPQSATAEAINDWLTRLNGCFDLSENPLNQLKQMAEQFILTIHLEEVGNPYEEAAANLAP